MKLQEQVCSLELSQQLKELGYKQESLFYYKVDEDREMGTSLPYLIMGNSRYMTSKGELLCSAPTVAELDSNLPYNVERPHKTKEGWVHALFSRPIESMPDAWAEVIAYLLQNKLIEL